MADDIDLSIDQRFESAPSQPPDKKKGRLSKGMGAAGKGLQETGRDMMDNAQQSGGQRPVAYKRGGKIRRTGTILAHKGERMIPQGKRRKVERLMKREGMSMRARR